MGAKDDERSVVAAADTPRHQSLYNDAGEIVFPEVTWWKHAGLRKLYIMAPILFLGSTINGYDGSLLNGLQTMEPWQECRY